MIYKANQTLINDYFADKESLSSTLLKSFVNGYDYYLETKRKMSEDIVPEKYYDEPKNHFIIGSSVDMELTHPTEDFTNTYYISTLTEKPSDTEISIIKFVYDNRILEIPLGAGITPVTMGNLLDHNQLLESAFQFHNYQPRYGFDAKKKAFDNVKSSTYWNELLASANRQILTLEDLALIKSLSNSFRTSQFTRFLFNDLYDDIDIFYQVPLYLSDYIKCKALIDIVVVNYSTGVITLYDIKTMADGVLNFPNEFYKRKYNIQAGFYHYMGNTGLLQSFLLNSYNLSANKKSIISRSIIDDFKFVVASKMFPNSHAVIYSVGKENLTEIVEGRSLSYSYSVATNGIIIDRVVPRVYGIKSYMNDLYESMNIGYDNRYKKNINLFDQ